MGIQLPPLAEVAYTAGGFIGTPLVEGFVNTFVPVDWQANIIGKYAIRIGSVVALSFLTKTVIGAREAKMVAIGGSAYVATSAIAEFLPGVLPGVGEYVQPTLGEYAQPTLGAYDTNLALVQPEQDDEYTGGVAYST